MVLVFYIGKSLDSRPHPPPFFRSRLTYRRCCITKVILSFPKYHHRGLSAILSRPHCMKNKSYLHPHVFLYVTLDGIRSLLHQTFASSPERPKACCCITWNGVHSSTLSTAFRNCVLFFPSWSSQPLDGALGGATVSVSFGMERLPIVEVSLSFRSCLSYTPGR
ncbi:hypothetical protein BC567DRAFT_100833 [Phyllosticta citribraziliensis]